MDQEKTTSQKRREWFSQYNNYIIIATVSIVALVFIPFLGSVLGLGWTLPDTATGWIVFIATKLLVAVINLIIFHSFVQQAKLNSKDNPNFLMAEELMATYTDDTVIPLSPQQFLGREYGRKGVIIFITSCLSAFALTQAVLTFDIATFISYVITIIFGLIFGVLEMKKNEEYWCITYLSFAKYYQKKKIEEEMAKERQDEEKIESIPETVCESEVSLMFPDTVDDN